MYGQFASDEKTRVADAGDIRDHGQFVLRESLRILQAAQEVSDSSHRKRVTEAARTQSNLAAVQSQGERMSQLHRSLHQDYTNILRGRKTTQLLLGVMNAARKVLRKLEIGVTRNKPNLAAAASQYHTMETRIKFEIDKETSQQRNVDRLSSEYRRASGAVQHARDEVNVLSARQSELVDKWGIRVSSMQQDINFQWASVQHLEAMAQDARSKQLQLQSDSGAGTNHGGADAEAGITATEKDARNRLASMQKRLTETLEELSSDLLVTRAAQRRLQDSADALLRRAQQLKSEQTDRSARVQRVHEDGLKLRSKMSLMQANDNEHP